MRFRQLPAHVPFVGKPNPGDGEAEVRPYVNFGIRPLEGADYHAAAAAARRSTSSGSRRRLHPAAVASRIAVSDRSNSQARARVDDEAILGWAVRWRADQMSAGRRRRRVRAPRAERKFGNTTARNFCPTPWPATRQASRMGCPVPVREKWYRLPACGALPAYCDSASAFFLGTCDSAAATIPEGTATIPRPHIRMTNVKSLPPVVTGYTSP